MKVTANENITAKSVRLIDGDNNKVMSLNEALDAAYRIGMDLVQVNEQDVPVVKIVELNKYLFEQKQLQKDLKRKQKAANVSLKEIQFSIDTQQHDLGVKIRNTQKFITENKHVKVVLKIPGRQSSNPAIIEKGKLIISDFVSNIPDAEYHQAIQHQGRNIICTIKSK